MLHLLAVCLWQQKTAKAPVDATTIASESPSLSTVDPIPSSSTPFKAVYVTCSSPFAEVETFVDSCAISYNLDLVRTTPGGLPMKEALQQYKTIDPKIKNILVGTRRDDPHGASLQFRTPTDEDWPAFIRVHPIINWTYELIWEYLREFDVPYCELYNQGYTSLGSTFNTFPNPALKSDNGHYKPAYELKDGREERYGRIILPRIPVQ
ncbi:hypothetical protein M408DRAFT_332660 [Serendipita vermifera MAFF 305830]|uniref:FAD synthase n=1 Tax=Serendipita vermifera MAFF 305830 TaxID=933852 RepID=A0A0C3AS57_SERVB|nr:hypothetical protein M408DRAFT_332660 [Serendipita vermifera MAFF 305830]